MSLTLGQYYDYVGMPPPFQMRLLPKFLWRAFFPQLVLWVGFTVVAGSMTGSLAAAWVRRQKVQYLAREVRHRAQWDFVGTINRTMGGARAVS